MELAIKSNPIPLKKDADGAIRVGDTRVTLETVLYAFEKDSTCEEIVHQYPVLDLADVYEVIGCFLGNRTTIFCAEYCLKNPILTSFVSQ